MLIHTLAFAAAVTPTLSTGLAQQPPQRSITLTAGQLLAWAERAEASGDKATAARIYETMQQDHDRRVRGEARFRLAGMLAGEGKARAAATLLRQVIDEQPEATNVRLALAQLLVTLGDEAGARRELRAAQAGPLPLDVARIVDRFSEALRVRKPFGASFEFAIAPDSNINRATRSDTVGTIIGPFDISDDGKARSGIGAALRGQVYGRREIVEEVNVVARIGGSADIYRQSEFNDYALSASAGPEVQLDGMMLRGELGATRRWFGGDPYLDSAHAAVSLTRPIGRRAQVRLSGSIAAIDHKVNDLQDGRGYSASVGIERALSATTGIAAQVSFDRQALKDPGYSTRGWRASLTGWRDIGRATFTASLDYGRMAADERLNLFPDKRRERYTKLSFGTVLRQFTVRGFAPIVRHSFERNHSSIEIYDYKRSRTEFGVTRAF